VAGQSGGQQLDAGSGNALDRAGELFRHIL
jgi:hypothetical protein